MQKQDILNKESFNMKVTYPETGIYEHELKAIDKIKKVFDRGEKTKNWRAYAGFEFMHKNGKKAVAKGSSEKFEYDLLIITHANILVIEFKDWNGKEITKVAGKWYVGNKEQDSCPVAKNVKKMQIIVNKLKLCTRQISQNPYPIRILLS
ncbi:MULTISPECIES: nuclease-related domain-containing protein [Acinetobacter]|uniref:NERD domain-containing protein n=1 Tax=Acinetobacter johnsonii TaxID=40214 RepID=A0AA42SRC4_ACIJO|nr:MULTISPECIES: nuclease-related domain-containing protein [Acinetobacter]MDH0970985.1 NERD domain-containing protein [Acinetobacter johnsonii]